MFEDKARVAEIDEAEALLAEIEEAERSGALSEE